MVTYMDNLVENIKETADSKLLKIIAISMYYKIVLSAISDLNKIFWFPIKIMN